MAKRSPREAGAPARAAVTACLNVAFLVLLIAAVHLSRRATGGDVDVFPNNGGGEPHGHGADSEDRCRRGHLAPAGRFDDNPRGHVDYLYLFHCVFGGGAAGYVAMAAWLAVLFYLLGDTAAVYFCLSLEGFSRLLGLPPAIAGATLLSLGNGAPDALSAVASFAAGAGAGPSAAAVVGLSGALGGALFVSSAVLGVIGVRLGGDGVAVDRASFFRDAAFLLLALAAVAVVLAVGEVTFWGAAAFASLYFVYVLAVAFTPDRWSRRHHHAEAEADADAEHAAAAADSSELHNVAEAKFYAEQEAQQPLLTDAVPLLQHYAGDNNNGGGGVKKRMANAFRIVLRAVELPLSLPRRLTIPDATSKEQWSKPTAVAAAAAALAPLLLSFLCRHATGSPPYLIVPVGALIGVCLGFVAFLTTESAAPPTRCLAAWLAGGFVMSVAWAYVVAGEVLALLVSAGHVLRVDAAALGVTVLAWGNSLGDLVTNVAVASRGGAGGGGAQVAVSGCYGGPVFSVLVGLGMSMLLPCWTAYPRPLEVPRDPGLYLTPGFVSAGVLWATVMLPKRGMRVNRTLGLGLLAIYFCFLCINVSQVLGPNGRE